MPRSQDDAPKVATSAGARTDTPKIRWDTSNLKSGYANFCNVTSTREEVVLNFGVNKAWERGAQEVEIELTDRLILSPFAAKRLAVITSYSIHYTKLYDARVPANLRRICTCASTGGYLGGIIL